MQAIILATDEQSRLPPLTDSTPAPLLTVVDKPVMANAVEILARAGCKHVLVSLYNRGGPIAAYFGSGKRWGLDIEYVTQREGWGSAGALRWAASLMTETFLVLPGDSIIDLDIEAALAYHRSHGGLATIILHKPATNSTVPTIQIAADNRIVGLGNNSPENSEMAVPGAFIFEPNALQHVPHRFYFDCVSDLIPALLAAGERVFGYEMDGYWNPLDSLCHYQEAQQVLLYSAYRQNAAEQSNNSSIAQMRFPFISGRQIAPGIWCGLNDTIHPTVKLAAPIYIGANSWLGREVELGAGTVIGSNVVVDEEATVSGSTILSETYIGRLVHVEHLIVNEAMMIDPITNDCIRVADPFLLGRVRMPKGRAFRVSRLFDTMVAACLLIILGPMLLVIWLLASIANNGHPFARRSCVGERIHQADGSEELRTFQLIHLQTRKADGNFIPLGRLIERWGLHRLPELINVLRNDIALVGVKPLMPEEAMLLIEDWQQKRYEAPAGMTGLWYLQSEMPSDLDTVLVADVYYVAMRSWRGDLLILLKTPISWFRRHKSYAHYTHRSDILIYTDTVASISHSELI